MNNEYNLTKAVERVKQASWYEGSDGELSMKGYVGAGIEASDHGKGIEIECTLYANSTLGTGATFDAAFTDLENKLGIKNIPEGEVSATV
jgi:hypothetical protein